MIRKLEFLAAASALLFFGSLLAERSALARVVGGNTLTTVSQPDQWCVGGSNQGTSNTATEVCVDWGGNFVPTTTNVQKLGSSSLQFNDVETSHINSGAGAVTIGGAATVSGALAVTGNVALSGQAGLLVQTTTQIVALTASSIGSLVVAKYNVGTPSLTTYALCVATATSVAGGGNDFVYVSSVTTANIGTACQ